MWFLSIDTIRTIKRNNHKSIIRIINKLNTIYKILLGLDVYLMQYTIYTITFFTFEYFKNSFKKKNKIKIKYKYIY